MVRELYYMGVYDKETLQAKTLEEEEKDSPWWVFFLAIVKRGHS